MDVAPVKYYEEVKQQLQDVNIKRCQEGLQTLSMDESKKLVKEILMQTVEERSKGRRQLSDHVVTRWYRPPEIILIEKNYGPAVDVWGVGCIMAEMLTKGKEHHDDPNTIKDQPLFPGKSCFPLSPDKLQKKEALQKFPFSDKDQLNVIIDVLGSPTEEDLSFVTDQTAINYLEIFPKDKVRIDFKKLFPYASDMALDFMLGMIQFNPFLRPNIEECLNHPFLAKVRKPEREQRFTVKINLDIDKIEEPTLKQLRDFCIREIQYYRQKKETLGPEFINK